MRLYLLPISTRRVLLYCEPRSHSAPATQTWTDKIVSKANSTWADWEKDNKAIFNWKQRTTSYGNMMFRRIPFEEWGLKSIPPLRKRKDGQLGEHAVVEVRYPGLYHGLCQESVMDMLRRMSAERKSLHTQRMWYSIAALPLTIPVGLLPIIPNIPFFYLVFRAYSHYRALAGSNHLTHILDNSTINREPSTTLDNLYTAGLLYPTRSSSRDAPDPSLEKSRAVVERVREQTNGWQEAVMLLRGWNGKLIAERLKLPSLEVEIERAVEQVEKGLVEEKQKGQDEIRDEKKEVEAMLKTVPKNFNKTTPVRIHPDVSTEKAETKKASFFPICSLLGVINRQSTSQHGGKRHFGTSSRFRQLNKRATMKKVVSMKGPVPHTILHASDGSEIQKTQPENVSTNSQFSDIKETLPNPRRELKYTVGIQGQRLDPKIKLYGDRRETSKAQKLSSARRIHEARIDPGSVIGDLDDPKHIANVNEAIGSATDGQQFNVRTIDPLPSSSARSVRRASYSQNHTIDPCLRARRAIRRVDRPELRTWQEQFSNPERRAAQDSHMDWVKSNSRYAQWLHEQNRTKTMKALERHKAEVDEKSCETVSQFQHGHLREAKPHSSPGTTAKGDPPTFEEGIDPFSATFGEGTRATRGRTKVDSPRESSPTSNGDGWLADLVYKGLEEATRRRDRVKE
ncbi:MAG: hypothetical protein M1831_003176 [Alyxoria varia]|nr:MAG: hypothetical protein M1831_003176 [Alyxoria varia]